MRIGIEVTGTQSASRHRGVGRYVHEFVKALLDLPSAHEFVLYGEAEGPADYLPDAPVELIAPDRGRGERDMTAAFHRVMSTNPDALDLMLITNPLELREDMLTPARPLNGLKLAAVMHDVIPLIFSEHYYKAWPGPEFVRRYRRGLDRVKSYDLLLANSEATRQDVIRYLGYPATRVATIMAASDAPCWKPAGSVPTADDRQLLSELQIDRPFVFSMGAMEYRKNIWGLLDAFARLPEPHRAGRLLVLTYAMNAEESERVLAYAGERGVREQIRITGRLSDQQLATLHRGCDVFVFPSLYEGFGLPVLEAMHCGAAVITGGNSSLVEVVGDAGVLVNVASAEDIGRKLLELLESPSIRAEYQRKAPQQAALFSWRKTAEKAVAALDEFDAGLKTVRIDRPKGIRSSKPRIAFFSPFPPMLSGVADYSERLVEEMRNDFVVDLFHDQDYDPSIRVRSSDHACHDHRMFRRLDAIRPYDSLIYQMGNSPLHKYIYDLIPIYPGIITLHDFNLAGFRFWEAMNLNGGFDAFRRDLEDFRPGLGSTDDRTIESWMKQAGGVAEACSFDGIYLNHRVFREALSVIVHSPWCLRRARAIHGELAAKTDVIPFGANVLHRTGEERAAIRAKYGIPLDAFVIGNFGLIHSTKMNVESLIAFAEVARERPDALFVLVGPEYDDRASRIAVAELGLANRVRFLGAKPAAEFVDLTAIADLGINLRRPPTNGETSAALIDLVRQGVATIVTDVGSFSDFPDDAVCKVRWDDQGGQAVLTAKVLRLSLNANERTVLGQNAQKYVAERHTWSNAVAMYAEIIERHGRGRPTSAANRTYRGPHRKLTVPAIRTEASR